MGFEIIHLLWKFFKGGPSKFISMATIIEGGGGLKIPFYNTSNNFALTKAN